MCLSYQISTWYLFYFYDSSVLLIKKYSTEKWSKSLKLCGHPGNRNYDLDLWSPRYCLATETPNLTTYCKFSSFINYHSKTKIQLKEFKLLFLLTWKEPSRHPVSARWMQETWPGLWDFQHGISVWRPPGRRWAPQGWGPPPPSCCADTLPAVYGSLTAPPRALQTSRCSSGRLAKCPCLDK